MDTFGLWLDLAIQAAELTKREVAKRAGVSDGLVYQVTTDGKKPTAEFCVRIAYALGIPTADVLKRAGFDVIAGAPGDTADDWTAEAWGLIQKVPAEYRAACLLALRAWASSDTL